MQSLGRIDSGLELQPSIHRAGPCSSSIVAEPTPTTPWLQGRTEAFLSDCRLLIVIHSTRCYMNRLPLPDPKLGMRRTVAQVWFFVIISTLLLRVSYGQWSTSPQVNNAICCAAGDQGVAQLVGDGSGGAIITWGDCRSANKFDIYAQRVDAGGVLQWTGGGVAIITANQNWVNPRLVCCMTSKEDI